MSYNNNNNNNNNGSTGWNFGDTFPSIEIDTEYWRTLSFKERGKYLLKLVFQEKNLGNRMNMLNYITNTTYDIVNTFVKNEEIREYAKILKSSTNLISVSAAIGNIFKARQKFKHIKNNEMAKLMGFPNGNYIEEIKLEITQSMVDTFINISDFHKEKYKLKIDQVQSDEKKDAPQGKEDDRNYNAIKNIKMAGTLNDDLKWGIAVKTIENEFNEDENTTFEAVCKLYHPVSGMKIHPNELKEQIQKIMYELYIDKIDTRQNYVKINGIRLDICKRIEIKEEIKNLDVNKIVKAGRKTLEEKKRRGVVLVGEPGVGKTISLHKIINNFSDKLVFWVSPDSINNIPGIRNVFKIFKMFKNSIIVFDDLDAAPLTRKDEITAEFLSQLDGTSDLAGFLIAAVNDPSKIHMTVINRPERFDDVFHVKLPETNEEIIDILFSKSEDKGYFPKGTKNRNKKGVIEFARNTPALKQICKEILQAKFTQVQVAGLINDCHTYTDHNNITISLLKDAVRSRMASIRTSNLIATKGRLKFDSEHISEEAKMIRISK